MYTQPASMKCLKIVRSHDPISLLVTTFGMHLELRLKKRSYFVYWLVGWLVCWLVGFLIDHRFRTQVREKNVPQTQRRRHTFIGPYVSWLSFLFAGDTLIVLFVYPISCSQICLSVSLRGWLDVHYQKSNCFSIFPSVPLL